MQKHVLITGGLGFLGHHALEHLLKNTDWYITILDGLRHVGDPARLLDIEAYDPARVKVEYHDLRSPIPTHLADRIPKPTYILNLASDSHVDRSIQAPADTIVNNISIAVNMLEYARAVKPDVFVQFSTDEVFGPITTEHQAPFFEWERLIPSNPYSASKASQDMIAVSYWRTFGLPIIITHCVNAYGERQAPEKFLPVCINNLLKGEPVPVHAEQQPDGTWQAGSRCWIHARNVADALLFILRNVQPAKYPEADRPDKFNISSDREIPNLEVVQRVAKALGVEPKYVYQDAHKQRPGHDKKYGLANDKLKALGWVPPVDLDESFRRCVLWEKARHG